jgi:MarR family 2-MHQ and catechol resistance regulon transcriptional repressor
MKREDLIQDIIETMARCQRPANFSSWSKVGLSHAQTGMLFMLSYHKRLQIKQIAEYLGITKSAASQMVDSLAKKELINRVVDTKDRRIVYISLTSRGQREFKKLHKLKFAGLRSRLGSLSTDELNLLSKLAHKMAAVPLDIKS